MYPLNYYFENIRARGTQRHTIIFLVKIKEEHTCSVRLVTRTTLDDFQFYIDVLYKTFSREIWNFRLKKSRYQNFDSISNS